MRIGIVGSRALSAEHRGGVCQTVEYLLERGHCICHGGAIGTDHLVLQTLLDYHCIDRGILFSPWQDRDSFPAEVSQDIQRYLVSGGQTFWGFGQSGQPYPAICTALRARNQRLVIHSDGLIAFVSGKSRGTLSTVSMALKRGIPVIVFRLSGDTALPTRKGMQWFQINKPGIFQGAFRAMYSFLPNTTEQHKPKKEATCAVRLLQLEVSV
ncbi:DNA-processing protein DprA [bacterium]|nr:DNA-processing protein DprA [bacterium]MDC0977720.1 DNA-processing protein DprA [bacterium]